MHPCGLVRGFPDALEDGSPREPEFFANGDGRFQLGELGAPRESGGAIATINQAFCHALDVGESLSTPGVAFLFFAILGPRKNLGHRKWVI